MGCGPERILGLWPRIGVKHVAFYGLWPGMTSLELWLGIAEEHEEPLVVAWVGECYRCECAVCGQYVGSRWIALLSVMLTSLVVLGRYRLCSYLGTSLGVTVCDP